MTKKHRSKPKTTIKTLRRFQVPPFDQEQLEDDFRHLFDLIWTRLLEHSPEDRDNVELMGRIVDICKLGWNIATVGKTPAGIQKIVAELIDDDDPNDPTMAMLCIAATVKRELFPGDVVCVDDAGLNAIRGEITIWVQFDAPATDPAVGAPLPKMEDILDRDALDKALEGVPPEQQDEALKAEIIRQTDACNNTPQDELGGLTPSEKFKQKLS